MAELRRLPPSEPQAVDQRRSTAISPERLPPADHADTPRLRAESAEPRTSSPREAQDPSGKDRHEAHPISDALTRFEPRQAGLPDVSKDDATPYIESRRSDRPWLNTARHAPAEVQQVFAALDQGGGHAHIRHEGWLSSEKSQMRVQYLEDPAQLDPAKRAEGKDGLLSGDKKHYCAEISAAIRDPTAFAVAFARGIEHPEVRRALGTRIGDDYDPPQSVSLPITDLLGPDGSRYCEGYRLAGDDMDAARRDRRTWLRETRAAAPPSVPSPMLVPVDFRSGIIEFRFKVNATRTGYEITTMFPSPVDREPEHP